MKRLFLLTLLALLSSCSAPMPKSAPEHQGVNAELKFYQDEFFELAASRGIYFNRPVSMGFKKLQSATSSTIGVCTYGYKWREIDIDEQFYNEKTELSRKALIFHELVHCYCTRDHTYGSKANILYPETNFQKFLYAMTSKDPKEPSHFDDGCPVSIMYPRVLTDECMWGHIDHYIDEMFNRCRPW